MVHGNKGSWARRQRRDSGGFRSLCCSFLCLTALPSFVELSLEFEGHFRITLSFTSKKGKEIIAHASPCVLCNEENSRG